MQTTARDKIIDQLCQNLRSIQKTKGSYIDKFGKQRFKRMNRRVYRNKLFEIVDLVAPSTPCEAAGCTRRRRRDLAIKMHNDIKQQAAQSTLPFMDEVIANPAEVIPFHLVSLRDEIKSRLCPELDKLEEKYGGINRELFFQRILMGCDGE